MFCNRFERGVLAAGLCLALVAACEERPGRETPAREAPPATEVRPEPARAPVVARVAGEELDLDALDAYLKDELFAQATRQRDPVALHRARSGALARMIDGLVLERAAERRGTSAEELLENELAARGPVTEEEVEAFHAASASQEPLEDAAPRIRRVLEARRREAVVAGLRERVGVEVLLASPYASLADDRPSRGPAGAPVTLVVFTDYASLDCARSAPIVEELIETHPEALRVVHRTFAREQSSFYNGRGAAAAAICGDRLGAFGRLHELLLANQRALAPDAIVDYAAEAGLDPLRFERCLGEDETETRLREDLEVAAQLRIAEAPAYLVNGRLVQGSKPLPVLAALVDSELRAGSP